MTLHLARLGYSRIGFVTLPVQDNDRSYERRRGYQAGLAGSGLPEASHLILEMPPGIGSGAEAIVRLVEADERLDAVFFAGDVLAVGALFECRRRGWEVPGRIAIATFDDVDILGYVSPTVTSVRIPRYEIGRRSAEVVLDRVKEGGNEWKFVDLGFQIISRESTRAVRCRVPTSRTGPSEQQVDDAHGAEDDAEGDARQTASAGHHRRGQPGRRQGV
jgi:LacI family gluconate utilization system Gnt-I transcriptional repressor